MWPPWKKRSWEDSAAHYHLHWLAADLRKKNYIESNLPQILVRLLTEYLGPADLVATASERGFLSLVETSSGQMVLDKDLGHGPLWSLAFAPDGQHVATASDGGFLSLVETGSGQMVFDKDLGHVPLWSFAFAPDGQHVATASDGGFLSLVETSSGQMVFNKDLDHGMLWSLAFAPDGQHVASASDSGFLSLVETSSGQMVFDKDLGHDVLRSLAFAPTSEQICIEKLTNAQSAVLVTSEVEHRDPPANIPAAEAAHLVELQWTTWIELRGGLESEKEDLTREDHTGTTLDARQLEYGEKIMLVNMSRVVLEYQTAMRSSRELKPVRTALKDSGHSFCIDPPGAHVIVPPSHYMAVRVLAGSLDLKAHHVLLAESLTPLFLDALKSLPSKKHVRIRQMSAFAIVSEDGEDVILVERTFFSKRPNQTRPSSSRTQSTTVPRGFENPRCHIRADNKF